MKLRMNRTKILTGLKKKKEKVQRRAARWTTSSFDYRSSTTEIINDLGWRALEQRRADARLCLFYKIVHGLVAVPLPDYIQPSNRISSYCHSMTFRQLHTTKNYYKKVQVGKDPENNSHSKKRGGKKQTNNQVLIP